MRLLYFASILIFATAWVLAIVCALTRRATVARVTGLAGLAALAIGVLSIVWGIVLAWQAMSAPGLGQAAQQRMLANFIAESLFNVVATGIAAAPALIASWWVLRTVSRGG